MVGSCRIGGTSELNLDVVRSEVASALGGVAREEVRGAIRSAEKDVAGQTCGEGEQEELRGAVHWKASSNFGSRSSEDEENKHEECNYYRRSGRSGNKVDRGSLHLTGEGSRGNREVTRDKECQMGVQGDRGGSQHRCSPFPREKAPLEQRYIRGITSVGAKGLSNRDKTRSGPRKGWVRVPRTSIRVVRGTAGIKSVGLEVRTKIRKKAPQEKHDITEIPCIPVHDRSIHEENRSTFGRAVQEALAGGCAREGDVERILVVDMYESLRREFRRFEGLVDPCASESRNGTEPGSTSDGHQDWKGREADDIIVPDAMESGDSAREEKQGLTRTETKATARSVPGKWGGSRREAEAEGRCRWTQV